MRIAQFAKESSVASMRGIANGAMANVQVRHPANRKTQSTQIPGDKALSFLSASKTLDRTLKARRLTVSTGGIDR